MNRRDFLLGTSALVMNFTAIGAQEQKALDAEVEIFDDFEQGYGKWEVTGTAFGTAPAPRDTTRSTESVRIPWRPVYQYLFERRRGHRKSSLTLLHDS